MEPFPIFAALGSPVGFSGALALFFALLIGHAVADFALQGEFLSTVKNRNAELSRFFGGGPTPRGVWMCALGAHSLIHAGAVWIVTGSVILGFVEFLLHAFIDFAKSERWTTFLTDQALHVVCKVIFVVILACGWLGMS